MKRWPWILFLLFSCAQKQDRLSSFLAGSNELAFNFYKPGNDSMNMQSVYLLKDTAAIKNFYHFMENAGVSNNACLPTGDFHFIRDSVVIFSGSFSDNDACGVFLFTFQGKKYRIKPGPSANKMLKAYRALSLHR